MDEKKQMAKALVEEVDRLSDLGGSHVEDPRLRELLMRNAEGKATFSETMREGLRTILGR